MILRDPSFGTVFFANAFLQRCAASKMFPIPNAQWYRDLGISELTPADASRPGGVRNSTETPALELCWTYTMELCLAAEQRS